MPRPFIAGLGLEALFDVDVVHTTALNVDLQGPVEVPRQQRTNGREDETDRTRADCGVHGSSSSQFVVNVFACCSSQAWSSADGFGAMISDHRRISPSVHPASIMHTMSS